MRAPARIPATRVGALRDPSSQTYLCARCGIERPRSGRRTTSGMCADCISVETPINHGTPSGVQQHRSRDEEPCDDCKAARIDYERTRKANIKTKGTAA